VGDTFSQETGGQTIVDNMKLDLLVASGGVLSHAPRMHQTAMMLIDAFQPEGFTTLAKDSIFMMPHLGVLAQVHAKAAMEVFERDCLINLGTCIAAVGAASPARPCQVRHRGRRLNETGELAFGDLRALPACGRPDGDGQRRPGARRSTSARGKGKRVQRSVSVRHGGAAYRRARAGRWNCPRTRRECRRTVAEKWVKAIDLYRGGMTLAVAS
jgi:hypothetical protein